MIGHALSDGYSLTVLVGEVHVPEADSLADIYWSSLGANGVAGPAGLQIVYLDFQSEGGDSPGIGSDGECFIGQ